MLKIQLKQLGDMSMVKYVVKKGGKFLAGEETGLDFTSELSKAMLLATRQAARSIKQRGEKIYRVKLDLVKNSFEKVS